MSKLTVTDAENRQRETPRLPELIMCLFRGYPLTPPLPPDWSAQLGRARARVPQKCTKNESIKAGTIKLHRSGGPTRWAELGRLGPNSGVGVRVGRARARVEKNITPVATFHFWDLIFWNDISRATLKDLPLLIP